MLTTALGAKPYCALKLLEMTRNSWVASALGKGAASRALVSMLETPSSRYQVLPCRWPPAEAPDSVGKELFPGKVEACDISSLVTPGDRSTRLDGSRPFSGRSLTSSSPTTWPISDVVVLRSSAPPVTVTVCCMAPG